MLTREDGCVTAGLLVMGLTSTVATTTYICSSARGLEGSGAVVALAELIASLRRTGCRWLDLGPSASESTLNAGVMLFKEGLGGVGYCRSHGLDGFAVSHMNKDTVNKIAEHYKSSGDFDAVNTTLASRIICPYWRTDQSSRSAARLGR